MEQNSAEKSAPLAHGMKDGKLLCRPDGSRPPGFSFVKSIYFSYKRAEKITCPDCCKALNELMQTEPSLKESIARKARRSKKAKRIRSQTRRENRPAPGPPITQTIPAPKEASVTPKQVEVAIPKPLLPKPPREKQKEYKSKSPSEIPQGGKDRKKYCGVDISSGHSPEDPVLK